MIERSRAFPMIVAGAALLGACEQLGQATGTAAPPPPTPTCPVQIANDSSVPVHGVFISNARPDWGPDRLAGVLPPSRAQNFLPLAAGLYDFRIAWANGRTVELRQVDACQVRRISVTNSGLVAR